MSKKRWTVWTVAFSMAAVMALTGCGAKDAATGGAPAAGAAADANSPEGVIKQFIEAEVKSDVEGLKAIATPALAGQVPAEFGWGKLNPSKYENIKINGKPNGDTAEYKVSYDTQTANGVWYTVNAQIKLKKDGGSWKVEGFSKKADAWC